MKLVIFKDTDSREVEVNPDNVSYIYSSGNNTAIVFAGRSAQPLMVKLARDVVRARLLGRA